MNPQMTQLIADSEKDKMLLRGKQLKKQPTPKLAVFLCIDYMPAYLQCDTNSLPVLF